MNYPGKARIFPLMVGPVTLREFMAIALIGGLLLLLAFGLLHLASGRDQDRDGARTLEGWGIVTGLVFPPGGRSSPAFLELDGHPVTLDLWDSGSALRLQSGQKVTFTYSVGRSGAWYIKRIERAPAN